MTAIAPGPTGAELVAFMPASVLVAYGVDACSLESAESPPFIADEPGARWDASDPYPLDDAYRTCRWWVPNSFDYVELTLRWYPVPTNGAPEAGLLRARSRYDGDPEKVEWASQWFAFNGQVSRTVHRWQGHWYVELAAFSQRPAAAAATAEVDLGLLAVDVLTKVGESVTVAEHRRAAAVLGTRLTLPKRPSKLSELLARLDPVLARCLAQHDLFRHLYQRSDLPVGFSISSGSRGTRLVVNANRSHEESTLHWGELSGFDDAWAGLPHISPSVSSGPVVYWETPGHYFGPGDPGFHLHVGDEHFEEGYVQCLRGMLDACSRLLRGERQVRFRNWCDASENSHWVQWAFDVSDDVVALRFSEEPEPGIGYQFSRPERWSAECKVRELAIGVARGALQLAWEYGAERYWYFDGLGNSFGYPAAELRELRDLLGMPEPEWADLLDPSDPAATPGAGSTGLRFFLVRDHRDPASLGGAVLVVRGDRSAFLQVKPEDGSWLESPELREAWRASPTTSSSRATSPVSASR